MFSWTKRAIRPGLLLSRTGKILALLVALHPAARAEDRLPGMVDSLLADRQFERALAVYQTAAEKSPLSFSRDYRVAAQLAAYLRKDETAFLFLKQAVSRGWEWKKFRKLSAFQPLRQLPQWKSLQQQYPALRKTYLESLQPEASRLVGKMFRKDQRKAFRAMLCFTSRGQDRYAERVFAPHSERQMARFRQILNTWGYPGEALVADSWRSSVILTHHNSISAKYAQRDTLYPSIRPRLLRAVQAGQLAPVTFAQIDDWYLVVKSEWKDKGYGYLSEPETDAERQRANALRAGLGLSSVMTLRRLKEVETETGIRFFLP